jgi:hypothetical protein
MQPVQEQRPDVYRRIQKIADGNPNAGGVDERMRLEDHEAAETETALQGNIAANLEARKSAIESAVAAGDAKRAELLRVRSEQFPNITNPKLLADAPLDELARINERLGKRPGEATEDNQPQV